MITFISMKAVCINFKKKMKFLMDMYFFFRSFDEIITRNVKVELNIED